MKRPDFGRYAMSIAGSEEVRAFVPAPLPPIPPLELIGTVRAALDQALLALGRLDAAVANQFSAFESIAARDARNSIARRTRRREDAWRVSTITELDWRLAPWERSLRTASTAGRRQLHGRSRAILALRYAASGQGGPGAYPVRDDPPVLRWKRTHWPVTDNPAALS